MAVLLVFTLIVIIGGMGFYVAHRPTVTPEEQDRIVRGDALPDTVSEKSGPVTEPRELCLAKPAQGGKAGNDSLAAIIRERY